MGDCDATLISHTLAHALRKVEKVRVLFPGRAYARDDEVVVFASCGNTIRVIYSQPHDLKRKRKTSISTYFAHFSKLRVRSIKSIYAVYIRRRNPDVQYT